MTTPRISALFDVSWEVCNKTSDNYVDFENKVQEASHSFGERLIAIGPDTGQAKAIFEDEVWDSSIHELLTLLPFGVRMGRWQISGNPRALLLKTDKLQSQKDEILRRYGQSAQSAFAPIQQQVSDAVIFAYAAGRAIQIIHGEGLLGVGEAPTVRAHDWPMLATVLYLKEKTPEIGVEFDAPTAKPARKAGVETAAHINLDVIQKFPSALRPLEELLYDNLWWAWHAESIRLVSDLDPVLWQKSGQDPVVFFRNVSPKALRQAAESKHYLDRLATVHAMFREYMMAKRDPEIAYFCMEYGLSAALRFYSGGLGILAGDHLKTASDLNIPLCAIGFAYREGYFKQVISPDGAQLAAYQFCDFNKTADLLPVEDDSGNRVRVKVELPMTTVTVQAWRVPVGRVDLYLLDTDIPENSPADRRISDRLYGGDNEHRLIQEFVLSVGGYRVLEAAGIKPKVFHMNEGHTSFLNLERLTVLKREGLSFDDSVELLRHSTIFTTHTPVPAGHDRFAEPVIRPYIKMYAEKIGVDAKKLHLMGVEPGKGETSSFSTTAFCVRTCERVNGVSALHGEVSRRMFQSYFPAYTQGEIPVTSITNGVHAGTWMAPEWQEAFTEHFGPDWRAKLSDANYWKKALTLDSKFVWDTHMYLKNQLIQWLKQYLTTTWTGGTTELAQALAVLDAKPFIATYARRFATYKRPGLLLKDLEELKKIFDLAQVPVVFLFAGKAHPMDKPGQEVIRQVVNISRTKEFAGRVIFVENYDMDKASKLVSGSDIWINNPTRPLEASGTSGMKAGMNGCLNFSVPDGWWAESFNGRNGWALGDASLDMPPAFQEAYDTTQIYLRLRTEVLPLYQRVNAAGVPEAWVSMMRESIATIVPMFSTARMLEDYDRMFYRPSIEDSAGLRASGFSRLKELGATRRNLLERWKGVQILRVETDPTGRVPVAGSDSLKVTVAVKHPELRVQDLLVQTLISSDSPDWAAASTAEAVPGSVSEPIVLSPVAIDAQSLAQLQTVAMEPSSTNGSDSIWSAKIDWERPGAARIGVRISPRNPVARHAEPDYDLNLVRWL